MTLETFYGRIDFSLLLIAGETLLAKYFPRRKYWWAWMILFSAMTIGLQFVEYFHVTEPYFYILYYVDFSITIIGMFFCFKAKWPAILMAGTLGYALQNFSYSSMMMIYTLAGLEHWWLKPIILIPIFVMGYTALQLMYIKRFNKARVAAANINAKRQVIIFIFAIAAICVMSGVSMGACETGNSFDKELGFKMFCLTYAYNICIAIITMTSELEIMLTGVKEKENGRIKALWRQNKDMYLQAKQSNESTNIMIHDLRHRIDNLSSNITDKEKSELEDTLERYSYLAKTGCEGIDMVLREKNSAIVSSKIQFTCLLDASGLSYIPKERIYGIFENAVTNAMNAVKDLPMNKRVISITGHNFKDYLSVHIENYFDPERKEVEKSVEEAALHGYGMKSIRLGVAEYDGQTLTSVNGDIFSLDIILPCKENPTLTQ